MSPNDAFGVIGSKPVFEDLNLSTEIQFSTDIGHLSTHSVYTYISVRKTKQNRLMLFSNCAIFGKAKLTFIKNWELQNFNISND